VDVRSGDLPSTFFSFDILVDQAEPARHQTVLSKRYDCWDVSAPSNREPLYRRIHKTYDPSERKCFYGPCVSSNGRDMSSDQSTDVEALVSSLRQGGLALRFMQRKMGAR
jgi:hypothetical protein